MWSWPWAIPVFFLLCSASSPDAVHVVLDRHLVTGQNENSTLPAVQNLLILCNVRWGKMGLKNGEQPMVSIFFVFQEYCLSEGVFPLGFLLKCVSLLFDQASQALVSFGKEHLIVEKKKMKMCGEVHSCSGAGKVKCWTGFTKHFCSGKQLLFPELGRLALSQLWFRILGMNVFNFFGNGLACLSVILSARGAHMNNLKPLILLRWVCGTSPVLCALTAPVVSGCVSFSRKWRRRSVCKEDGWRASRLRISMAVTWTKHPSEPLSWTLKWLWQCQVLCGWNGWRLSGAAGTLPYIFAVPFSHCFSRSSVYRCRELSPQNPPKIGAVNTNCWSPCSGLALCWCTECPCFLPVHIAGIVFRKFAQPFFLHGPTIVCLFSFVLLMLWVLFSWKYSSLGVHCCCLLLEFCGLGHWKMQVVNVGPIWGTSCGVESGLLLPSELQVWLEAERGKE